MRPRRRDRRTGREADGGDVSTDPIFLTAGAHPLGLELGGRVLDMGALAFVEPRTDTYRRDLSAVEFRAGITIGR